MRYLKAYLPVVIWMAVIFVASTDVGSSRRTSRFIGPFLRWFKPDVTQETIRAVQAVVRKTGHLTEYAILAALMWRSRRKVIGPSPHWNKLEAAVIVFVAGLYAISDELHQHFVSSRQASSLDVLIDTIGAVLGLFAIWAIGKWKGKWGTRTPVTSEGAMLRNPS